MTPSETVAQPHTKSRRFLVGYCQQLAYTYSILGKRDSPLSSVFSLLLIPIVHSIISLTPNTPRT